MSARERLGRIFGPDALELLALFVGERVEEVLARPDRPWLTVEETAEMLQTTPGAIRQRISTGWLAGDTVRDGKRRFIRREAVIRELEERSKGG